VVSMTNSSTRRGRFEFSVSCPNITGFLSVRQPLNRLREPHVLCAAHSKGFALVNKVELRLPWYTQRLRTFEKKHDRINHEWIKYILFRLAIIGKYDYFEAPLQPTPQKRTRTGQVLQTTITVAILLATLFTAFSLAVFECKF